MLPSRPGGSLKVAEPRVSPPRFDVAGILPSRPGVDPFTASPGTTPAGGPRKSGPAGLKSGNFGTPCPYFCAAASSPSDSAAIATVEKYQLLLALMAVSLLRPARQGEEGNTASGEKKYISRDRWGKSLISYKKRSPVRDKSLLPRGDGGCCNAGDWRLCLQDRADEAAVDPDRGAGDVARLRRGEEGDQVGQLHGLADAAQGGLLRALAQRFLHRNAQLLRGHGDVAEHALG